MSKIKSYYAILSARFLLRRQRKFYHKSVETLSIGAWWKVQEEIDFKWLVNDSLKAKIHLFFFNLKEDKTPQSAEIWEQIYNSYIKYVGLEDEYMEMIRAKVELHRLMCDRIITGNQFITNYIVQQEAKILYLNSQFKDSAGGSNQDTLNALEESRRIAIDTFKMSVVKYYSLIKYYTSKRKKEASLLNKKAA